MKPFIYKSSRNDEWLVRYSENMVIVCWTWTWAVHAVTGWLPYPMYIQEAGGNRRLEMTRLTLIVVLLLTGCHGKPEVKPPELVCFEGCFHCVDPGPRVVPCPMADEGIK